MVKKSLQQHIIRSPSKLWFISETDNFKKNQFEREFILLLAKTEKKR